MFKHELYSIKQKIQLLDQSNLTETKAWSWRHEIWEIRHESRRLVNKRFYEDLFMKHKVKAEEAAFNITKAKVESRIDS